MTHEELLFAVNSVAEADPCETVGHWSCAKALRAVVELHYEHIGGAEKSVYCYNCQMKYPCPTIQAIEKELK
jgi:hypothetical protein